MNRLKSPEIGAIKNPLGSFNSFLLQFYAHKTIRKAIIFIEKSIHIKIPLREFIARWSTQKQQKKFISHLDFHKPPKLKHFLY